MQLQAVSVSVCPSGLTAVTEEVMLHGECVGPDGTRVVSAVTASCTVRCASCTVHCASCTVHEKGRCASCEIPAVCRVYYIISTMV